MDPPHGAELLHRVWAMQLPDETSISESHPLKHAGELSRLEGAGRRVGGQLGGYS
ncbi:MAG TPA: hypothetical protein VLJ79_30365 [Candidatus Binatia bacterium]|nr:hypothetical protein [Candidatus Binatia bacterium]